MIKQDFVSFQLKVFTLALLVSFQASAAIVEIDATSGNTEVDVQAALDSNPPGTTFIMKGVFEFSEHVVITKSNTTIRGEMIDDGDGSAGPSDTWNTIINGTSTVGFELLSIGDFPETFEVSNVSISGIKFTLGVGIAGAAYYEQTGCGGPLNISNVKITDNYFEDSGIFFLGNVDRASIDNNFFSSPPAVPRVNPINLLGGPDFNCLSQPMLLQQGNSITNNTFDDVPNIYSGFNVGLRISGNNLSRASHPGSPEVITLFEQQDVLVSDNLIQSQSTEGPAILIFSRNLNPNLPGIFSRNITIKNNEMVDWETGIVIFGPLNNSKIVGNLIKGTSSGAGIVIFSRSTVPNVPENFNTSITIQDNELMDWRTGVFVLGPLSNSKFMGNYIHRVNEGILLADNASLQHPSLVGQSSKVEIKNNHFEDFAVSGVIINADTSGVRMVNNSFMADSIFGDILLAPIDVVWFSPGMCPASGNTIIGGQSATEVVTFGAPACEGDEPNQLLGNAKILEVAIP